jgi:hypothetical protein
VWDCSLKARKISERGANIPLLIDKIMDGPKCDKKIKLTSEEAIKAQK